MPRLSKERLYSLFGLGQALFDVAPPAISDAEITTKIKAFYDNEEPVSDPTLNRIGYDAQLTKLSAAYTALLGETGVPFLIYQLQDTHNPLLTNTVFYITAKEHLENIYVLMQSKDKHCLGFLEVKEALLQEESLNVCARGILNQLVSYKKILQEANTLQSFLQHQRELLIVETTRDLFGKDPKFGNEYLPHTLYWFQVYAHESGFGTENPIAIEDIFNDSPPLGHPLFLRALLIVYFNFITEKLSPLLKEMLLVAAKECEGEEDAFNAHAPRFLSLLQQFLPHFWQALPNHGDHALMRLCGTEDVPGQYPLLVVMDDDFHSSFKINPLFAAQLENLIHESLCKHRIFCSAETQALATKRIETDTITIDAFNGSLFSTYLLMKYLTTQPHLTIDVLLALLKTPFGPRWMIGNSIKVADSLVLASEPSRLLFFESLGMMITHTQERAEQQFPCILRLLTEGGAKAATLWTWLIKLAKNETELNAIYHSLFVDEEGEKAFAAFSYILHDLLETQAFHFWETLYIYTLNTHQYPLLIRALATRSDGISTFFFLMSRLSKEETLYFFLQLTRHPLSPASNETVINLLCLFQDNRPTLMTLFFKLLSPLAMIKQIYPVDDYEFPLAKLTFQQFNNTMHHPHDALIPVTRGHTQVLRKGSEWIDDKTVTVNMLSEVFTAKDSPALAPGERRRFIADLLWDRLLQLATTPAQQLQLLKVLCTVPAEAAVNVPFIFYILSSISATQLPPVWKTLNSWSLLTREATTELKTALVISDPSLGVDASMIPTKRGYRLSFDFQKRESESNEAPASKRFRRN